MFRPPQLRMDQSSSKSQVFGKLRNLPVKNFHMGMGAPDRSVISTRLRPRNLPHHSADRSWLGSAKPRG